MIFQGSLKELVSDGSGSGSGYGYGYGDGSGSGNYKLRNKTSEEILKWLSS